MLARSTSHRATSISTLQYYAECLCATRRNMLPLTHAMRPQRIWGKRSACDRRRTMFFFSKFDSPLTSTNVPCAVCHTKACTRASQRKRCVISSMAPTVAGFFSTSRKGVLNPYRRQRTSCVRPPNWSKGTPAPCKILNADPVLSTNMYGYLARSTPSTSKPWPGACLPSL